MTGVFPPIHSLDQSHSFPGKLIIVEGIDGSGKCTQLQLLRKWLENKGFHVLFTEWNSSALVREATKHWESGMDLKLGSDLYESFKKYQALLIEEFDKMAEEYKFAVVDARKSPDTIQETLRSKISPILHNQKIPLA